MNLSQLMEVCMVGGIAPTSVQSAGRYLTAAGRIRLEHTAQRGGAAVEMEPLEVLLTLLCAVTAMPGVHPDETAHTLSNILTDDPRAATLLGSNDLWAVLLTQFQRGVPDIHEVSLDRGATGAAIVTTDGTRLEFHNPRYTRRPAAARWSVVLPARLLRLVSEAAHIGHGQALPYGERTRLWAEWRLERLAPLGVHPLMGAA